MIIFLLSQPHYRGNRFLFLKVQGSEVQGFNVFGRWLLAPCGWPVVGSQQQEASDQQPATSEPLNAEPLNQPIGGCLPKQQN